MREIVLDTETTGLEHEQGHRIIEIGAVELNDHIPTGRHYHVYINPERDIDARASEVHGMTYEMLKDKPVFADIVDEFLAFIADATLVIHNADFDMGFINAELSRLGQQTIGNDVVIDTLLMARQKFPGGQASLDALCRRFSIDNSNRDLHGALIDADLLAAVYIELIGGKQPDLMMAESEDKPTPSGQVKIMSSPSEPKPPREFSISPEELLEHQEFMKTIDNSIWAKYQA
jgi:DNA polymerase-3 subunit epsilon